MVSILLLQNQAAGDSFGCLDLFHSCGKYSFVMFMALVLILYLFKITCRFAFYRPNIPLCFYRCDGALAVDNGVNVLINKERTS